MKALVWQGPERMEVAERPEPGDCSAGEVLMRAGAVGICGSEVEGYLGHMGNRTPPLVMGHEFAGEIVAAGDGAEEWIGKRAAVNPFTGCGHCALCRAGEEQLCPERTLIGAHRDGAFADLVRVPAISLRALPDSLDIRVGALTEPLANGVHAVRLGLTGFTADCAVVIGAGTIGLVIDAAGAQATRAMALELVRPGGRIVCIGLASDDTTLSFHTLVRQQITLIGSYAYTMADFEQSLEWLASGRASLGELAPVQPLEDGPEAFARLAKAPPEQVKVFLAGAGRGS